MDVEVNVNIMYALTPQCVGDQQATVSEFHPPGMDDRFFQTPIAVVSSLNKRSVIGLDVQRVRPSGNAERSPDL
jgi:hypothetical protein